MKAQSLRRLLWTTDGLLTLGLGAVAFVYFVPGKDASAGMKKEPWIEQSTKAYNDDKLRVQPANLWPVSKDELDATIIHSKDWMSPQVGVWPYVGPLPPSPKPVETAPPPPPQPKGLEAIGSPGYVIIQPPPGKSLVKWIFGSKKAGFFSTGEFVSETDPTKGRFKLVSIERIEGPDARVRIRYDVYDDPTKPPVETNQASEFALFKESDRPNPFQIPGAKGGPGAPAPTRPLGTPPSVADARKAIRVVPDSTGAARTVDIEQDGYDYLASNRAEDIVSHVKTEEAKDASGQPKGLRITDIGEAEESIAASFDVQRGDILKSINGRPVHNRAQAIDVVKSLPKDTTNVQAVVERNGRDIVYNIDPRDPKVKAAAGKVRFDNAMK